MLACYLSDEQYGPYKAEMVCKQIHRHARGDDVDDVFVHECVCVVCRCIVRLCCGKRDVFFCRSLGLNRWDFFLSFVRVLPPPPPWCVFSVNPPFTSPREAEIAFHHAERLVQPNGGLCCFCFDDESMMMNRTCRVFVTPRCPKTGWTLTCVRGTSKTHIMIRRSMVGVWVCNLM